MHSKYSTVACGRLAGILLAASLLQACSGDDFRAENGSLELNGRLRADLGDSSSMSTGSFFADGVCGTGSSNNDECHLITPVLSSVFSARNDQFTHRLRKSNFLWVAAEGFPKLSYEFVARNVNIVALGDPSNVFASGVDAGTCHGFPMRHPDSRDVLPALEDVEFENLEAYLQQFDVKIHRCTAPAGNNSVSTTLDPVTSGCTDLSVNTLVGGNPPPAPQNAPFCLLGRGEGMLSGDVSFSVMAAAAPGFNVNELWPGIDTTAKTLLPNLKTVPVGGIRTISRPLNPDAGTPNDDGTTTYRYTWGVTISGNKWSENFSPNIFVSKARVRRGPVGSEDFISPEKLDFGAITCGTRDATATEFDIPMCQPGSAGMFRVTPAYNAVALTLGPVTDTFRAVWTAFVRIPDTEGGPYSNLSIEFDLSADPPTGTMGSGLMAAPPTMDLGQHRNGQQATPAQAFTVRNYGVASLWVQSVSSVGGNAAEFGAPLIYRTTQAGVPTGIPITAPLILRGGSQFAIRLAPTFQNLGSMRTEVVVSFLDTSNTSRNIRMPVQAYSVTPAINLQPAHMVFNAVPGAGRLGAAAAQRAAILSNDGPVTFQRIGFTLSGPDASAFRLLSAEFGAAVSDGSLPQTLGPGAAEVYRLGYYPNRMGEASAYLTAHTTEGDVRVQLHGWCEQACEQPTVLEIDPRPALPPMEAVEVVYPKIRVKWSLFGTKTKARDDGKD